jgi:hypothetical protein
MPGRGGRAALNARFPDAMLFEFPKTPGQIARDFKWLGSYRYGILHLGGSDLENLGARCQAASQLLGWPATCAGGVDLSASAQDWAADSLALEIPK